MFLWGKTYIQHICQASRIHMMPFGEQKLNVNTTLFVYMKTPQGTFNLLSKCTKYILYVCRNVCRKNSKKVLLKWQLLDCLVFSMFSWKFQTWWSPQGSLLRYADVSLEKEEMTWPLRHRWQSSNYKNMLVVFPFREDRYNSLQPDICHSWRLSRFMSREVCLAVGFVQGNSSQPQNVAAAALLFLPYLFGYIHT